MAVEKIRPPEWAYYRKMISHRAAVRALVDINVILSPYMSPYFSGYEQGNPGEYDRALNMMVEEIRRMKEELRKFRELKAALKAVL